MIQSIFLQTLLKAIAGSDTLIALFKNCLTDFNYEEAQKKYLVKSPYLSSDKGEFIHPPNTKDLLALTFTLLADFDARRINMSEFLNKYFYVDGSCASGYDAFINAMIIPFTTAVKTLMESVIDGKLQDPVEALTEQENKRQKEIEEEKVRKEKDAEIAKKSYGEAVKKIREILLKDKQKVKEKKLDEDKKEEMTLVIDMLANAMTSEDRDAIIYAYVAYKFMAKAHPILFFRRASKIFKLLKDVLNAI